MRITIDFVCGLLSTLQMTLPVAAQSASETLLSLSSQALGALNVTDSYSTTKRSTGHCSLSQAYARKDW